MKTITVCMGSSCFSRGNQNVLAVLQAHLTAHPEIAATLELKGCRCGSCCSEGPNIWVDGVRHANIAAETVLAQLNVG